MCDTLIALSNATADGSVIFAKNSDREPNEAHEVLILPAKDYASGSQVRCTYIEVPQVEHTQAVLLAKPFNIWGAEMGANERGVVIGNEAVFTRVPYDKKPGLTGMDMIRIALERTESARAALNLIVGLLDQFGQGGNCGFAHPMYYHNSFLIGDRKEAWVLETAGKHWAAQQVKDVRSISNQITIGKDWDLASSDLAGYAVGRGWCKDKDRFDFARCYTDPLYTYFGDSRHRWDRSTSSLFEKKGQITVETMMEILRDHGENRSHDWNPGKGIVGAEVCMHAGFGPVRIDQTVGSLIAHVTASSLTLWVTGTSAPCTSIFKPVWIDAGMPDTRGRPNGKYDDSSLWWQHERLHRQVLLDYPARSAIFFHGRDRLEADFLRKEQESRFAPADERFSLSAQCFQQADEATSHWMAAFQSNPVQKSHSVLYRFAWDKFNREASFPEKLQTG